jgi:hypothetical protein
MAWMCRIIRTRRTSDLMWARITSMSCDLLTKSSAPDSSAWSSTCRFSCPERINSPSCSCRSSAQARARRQTSKPFISGITTSTMAM